MRKIVLLIISALMVLSFSGFTPDQPHKKPQSAKMENSKKKNNKGGKKPRKSKNKNIQKSKSKRHPSRSRGRSVKV